MRGSCSTVRTRRRRRKSGRNRSRVSIPSPSTRPSINLSPKPCTLGSEFQSLNALVNLLEPATVKRFRGLKLLHPQCVNCHLTINLTINLTIRRRRRKSGQNRSRVSTASRSRPPSTTPPNRLRASFNFWRCQLLGGKRHKQRVACIVFQSSVNSAKHVTASFLERLAAPEVDTIAKS